LRIAGSRRAASARAIVVLRVGRLDGDLVAEPFDGHDVAAGALAGVDPGFVVVGSEVVVDGVRGRGLARRSTATSCCSTKNSAFLDADDRPSRPSQPQSRTKMGWSRRRNTDDYDAVRLTMAVSAGHRACRLLEPTGAQRRLRVQPGPSPAANERPQVEVLVYPDERPASRSAHKADGQLEL
jgi:hypothetical protein